MTITIAPELESKLREKARAEGVSIEAYVAKLIEEDELWAEQFEKSVSEADTSESDVHAAVAEGLEQAEQGEARTAAEVFGELRAKHGIPHRVHTSL